MPFSTDKGLYFETVSLRRLFSLLKMLKLGRAHVAELISRDFISENSLDETKRNALLSIFSKTLASNTLVIYEQ